MAWGRGSVSAIDGWVARLEHQDPAFTSLHVLPSRPFAHEDVRKLCAALENNTMLRELSASGHAMPPDTAAFVSQMLARNSTLQSLSIGDVSFGDAGITALCPGLTQTASLQRLDLESKGMTAEGAAHLGAALSGNSSLTQLTIARNELGCRGVEALAPGLAYLRSLDLSSCGIREAGSAALASLLHSGQLTSLRLNSNPLSPQGAAALAAGLGNSRTLQELHLMDTNIGPAGVAALADVLQPASPLQRVDISSCQAGGGGLKALCLAIGRGTNLQAIVAASDSVTGDALATALKLLPTHGSLAELDLASNKGAAAVDAIEVLAHQPALRKLSLFACGVGLEAIQKLVAEAEAGGWKELHELDLGGNDVDLPAAQMLLTALQGGACPRLQVLLLGANAATEDSEEFARTVQPLRDIRPQLDIAFRTSAGLM